MLTTRFVLIVINNVIEVQYVRYHIIIYSSTRRPHRYRYRMNDTVFGTSYRPSNEN